MWEFSNSNSGSTFWPPDSGQPQNSIACPNTGISHGPSFCGFPFPGFRLQGNVLQFNNSPNWSPMNKLAPNPTINFSEPEATKTKRLLVFDYSGDQTSLVFSSVASPFEGLNPTLPVGSVANTNASNSHVSEENEMHEDTEEINALLYSDSEYVYDDDDDESSTGHSPLDMEKEDIASSYLAAKRRRIDSNEIDTLLMDTASSSVALTPQIRSRSNKRDSIRATVKMLRRIIPGGKGKDTVSVLDEAIQYLKSLQLQAKAAGADSFAL